MEGRIKRIKDLLVDIKTGLDAGLTERDDAVHRDMCTVSDLCRGNEADDLWVEVIG